MLVDDILSLKICLLKLVFSFYIFDVFARRQVFMDSFSFSFFCRFPFSLSNARMGRLTSSTRCKFLDLCMLMPFEIMKEIF